jgi:hypothetical protein
MANEMAILQIVSKLWLVRSFAVKVGSIAADMTRWPMMAIMSWAPARMTRRARFDTTEPGFRGQTTQEGNDDNITEGGALCRIG